jgi:hypothetical protein
MSNQNKKLAQAYRYGWQAAMKCLQDVYKQGVDPLAEIIVLEHFKQKEKKRKPIKEGENE